MSKLVVRIAIPIILAGLFAVIVFIATGYENQSISFYIILLTLTIFMFFFGLAVGQSLSRPVNKILKNANNLSRGDLSSRVYLETKDEFSELARAFNRIAEELEASQKQGENAEKEVGIKVVARTKELEETIKALEQKVKNRTIEFERLLEKANNLQDEVKSKKQEADQLKMELETFKQKSSRTVRSKKEIGSENNS